MKTASEHDEANHAAQKAKAKMGRPSRGLTRQVTIMVDDRTFAALDMCARGLGVTRSEAARLWLEAGRP